MREIKFRAWDGSHMWKVGLIDFDYNKVCMKGYKGFTESVLNEPILMQYTGLKDKKGKEIYEGDIVLISTQKGRNIHTIEWVNHLTFIGWRAYGLNRRWNTPITRSRVCNGDYEIIGNIYENPELLE